MRRRWWFLGLVLAMSGLTLWAGLALLQRDTPPERALSLKVQLRGARDKAWLFRDDQGQPRYRITLAEGRTADLTPEQFSQRLLQDDYDRNTLERWLNVASPVGLAWVVLGFVGQLLFAGRMLVQWIASERRQRSVVPPVFWWMSLVGSSMLLAYFFWRWDPVGILGQLLGWVVYVRNLWLIYGRPQAPPAEATEDPAPEPELPKRG